jgi:diacylglycerol O-acyltransferase / wax synthase
MSTSAHGTELSASDRLMWRIERDPILRSSIVVIGLLDREPDWDLLRATLMRAAATMPRLRQVVDRSGLGGRGLRWRDAGTFSIDYHLRRLRAPEPATMRSVLDLAAPWAAAALDPARPHWELTLVEGVESDRAAFILRFHHTISDGVGGVDLADIVFDIDRAGTPPPPPAREPSERAARSAPKWRNPAALPGDAWQMFRSTARMLRPAPDALSPLFRDRGLDRRLDVLEIPMGCLTGHAHALGHTVNDVFLATVAGALHEYHERLGHKVPALRVTMPINLRREADPPGGNRFTPARFVLPIDDPDPARRARIAGAIARRWRAEPAVGYTSVLAAGLDRLPPALVTTLFESMLKHVDVDVVDVPGLRRAAYLGGAHVDRLWAFSPPTGAALSVTLLSHGDTGCISLLSDLAAVEDPALRRDCVAAALAHWAETAPAIEAPVAS